MLILVDTGILLRLLDRNDAQYAMIWQALRLLRGRGDTFAMSAQNAAEFWNVCTRPATARGGLGLTLQETERRLRVAERLFPVLADTTAAYPLWRQLVVRHAVMGTAVHDARLVAWMQTHGISHILTLNATDFTRYPGIAALTPQDVLAFPVTP